MSIDNLHKLDCNVELHVRKEDKCIEYTAICLHSGKSFSKIYNEEEYNNITCDKVFSDLTKCMKDYYNYKLKLIDTILKTKKWNKQQ